MKKIKSLFLVAIVAFMLVFASCQKEECITDQQSSVVSYIDIKDVAFVGKEGNLKSLPIGSTRTYTYLINQSEGGSLFPAPAPNPYSPYKLLGEQLFFVNSAPWIFWNDPAHNPETFDMTGVYSNYSPTVPSRMVCIVKNLQGQASYLGISDFTPNVNLFPLAINNQQIGALAKVNAQGLKGIPGVEVTGITITIDKMAKVDTLATAITSGPTTTATGAVWPTWKYVGSPSSQTFTLTAAQVTAALDGDVEIYNHVELNILPDAKITIAVQIAGITSTQIVDAPAIGKGIKLILKTDKEGWYDSNGAVINENPLVVESKDVYFE